MSPVKPTPGERVARHRRAKGWTQEELARRAGLSVFSLSRIEQGRQRPALDVIETIAAAMGLSMPEFYDAAA